MFNWDEYVPPPSDATFVGWWQVSQRSRIRVQEPTRSLKGLLCSIHQLLEGSDYADRFKGGVFTHSFLNTFDHHRWHAPVRGKVVAARVLQGQAHLDVAVGRSPAAGTDENVILTRDGTAYQFVLTRGLVIIDSPVRPRGLPAHRHGAALVGGAHRRGGRHSSQRRGARLLPVRRLRLRDGCERASNVQRTGQVGVHTQQGSCIGAAYPVMM